MRKVEHHAEPAPRGSVPEGYEHALLAAGGRQRDEFGRNCLVTNEVSIYAGHNIVGLSELPLCVRMPSGWPNPPSRINVRHVVTGGRFDRDDVMRSLLDDVDVNLVHLYRGRRDAETRVRCVYEMHLPDSVCLQRGGGFYYEWQTFPVVTSDLNRFAFDFRGVVRPPSAGSYRWKVQILY